MNREELKEYICPADVCNDCSTGESGISCSKCDKLLNRWLEQYDAEIRAEAEEEHKAMCETCIHKVSKEDIEQIRASAIDDVVKKLAESEDTILTDKQYYTLMELKEQKNE